MLVPGPMKPVLGVTVEYPHVGGLCPARPVTAFTPGAPALLCPGTHAARPRDAALGFHAPVPRSSRQQNRSPPPHPPPPPPPAASRPSARAGSDAGGPGAPPFPPRAPPRPVSRPRAPPPPRRWLSVSRCPLFPVARRPASSRV